MLGILGIKRSILSVVLHGVNWSIKGVLILANKMTDLGYPDILRSLFCSQQSATLRGYRQISAPRHVAKKSSSSHGMCIGDSDATVQLAKTTVSRLFKPLKKLTLRAIPIADVNSEKVYKQIQVLSVHSLHLHLESLFLVIRNGQGNHSVMHTLTNAAGCDAVKREFFAGFCPGAKVQPSSSASTKLHMWAKTAYFYKHSKTKPFPYHFLTGSIRCISTCHIYSHVYTFRFSCPVQFLHRS